MEGLAADMTEEDVRSLLPYLPSTSITGAPTFDIYLEVQC
jgi:hypothetical protein